MRCKQSANHEIRPPRPSYRVLSDALCLLGRKALALTLGVSVSYIDKQCEEPRSDNNPDGSGTRNFLDYYFIACKLLRESGHDDRAHDLARWAASVAGGYFTPNPAPLAEQEEFCAAVDGTLKSTAATLQELRQDYFERTKPGRFTEAEAERILADIHQAHAALEAVAVFVEKRRG